MKIVEVVTGVVMREDRLLLTQRGTLSDFAFMWESPGGKVADGEAPLTALRRELYEEIGMSVAEISGPFYRTAIELPGREIGISFFLVRPPRSFVPSLFADENVIGAGWFTFAQACELPCLPGNVRLFEHFRVAGLPR